MAIRSTARGRCSKLRGALLVASIAITAISGEGVAGASPGRFAKVPRQPTSLSTIRLTGAGSTFDAPFFAAAFARYHALNPDVSISYAAIGSGDGIKRFSAGSVDFGASDVPMSASELSVARGRSVLQVPVDLGAVVVSYNLVIGATSAPIRLTGPVLAGIFLGHITRWDDPAITALNPQLDNFDENITVIHRSDSSGTTYIFTNYLSSTSPAWATRPGTNKSIAWPVGLGGMGSAGVAALLRRTPGSIGYFELSYAEKNELPYATLENQAGTFVPPFTANVVADAAMNPHVTSTDFSIVNEQGARSYPISGYSWILVYEHQRNQVTTAALENLIGWLTHAGQAIAAANYYVPLPASIRSLAAATIAKMDGPFGLVNVSP
jgi:phosphate transport system substrate-binding protein